MKVTLTLATTEADLAPDASFGFYRYSTTGQDDVDTAQTTVEYDLPAGDYTCTAQAYDADGGKLAAARLDFSVPAAPPVVPPPMPAKTYGAPTGLTVKFG